MRLPPELIGAIASHCRGQDLKNLARTNRACQREAEAILYKCVELCRKRSVVLGLRAIVDSLERANYIRTFTLVSMNPRHKHRPIIHTFLLQALLAMTGLKHLELQLHEYFYKDGELLNTLRKCTFPLLTLSTHTDLADCAMALPSLISVDLVDSLRYPSLQVAERLTKHPSSTGFLHVHASSYQSMMLFPSFAPIVDGKSIWSASHARQHPRSGLNWDIVEVYAFVKSVSEENLIDILTSIATNFPHVKLLELIVQDHTIHQNPHILCTALPMLRKLDILIVNLLDNSYSLSWSDQAPRLAAIWALRTGLSRIRFLNHTYIFDGVDWIVDEGDVPGLYEAFDEGAESTSETDAGSQ